MTDDERTKLAAAMIDDALEGLSDEQIRGTHTEAAALLLRTATALRHGDACECPECFQLAEDVNAWLDATQADTYCHSLRDKVKTIPFCTQDNPCFDAACPYCKSFPSGSGG